MLLLKIIQHYLPEFGSAPRQIFNIFRTTQLFYLTTIFFLFFFMRNRFDLTQLLISKIAKGKECVSGLEQPRFRLYID